jgi:hypothetical protein
MNKFEIGEIAICMPDPLRTPNEDDMKYKGEECEVIEGPKQITLRSDRTIFGYAIKFRDDKVLYVEPDELRKRQDPTSDELQKWAKKKVDNLLLPLITPVPDLATA